jgi:hypothetical protein
MRSILSLSVPEQKKAELEQRAAKANKTLSAYVLNSLELINLLISEDELAEMIKKAEKNYKKGKTKELKSLSDLMSE